MSSWEYTTEDFEDLDVPENASKLYILAAVCERVEILDKEKEKAKKGKEKMKSNCVATCSSRENSSQKIYGFKGDAKLENSSKCNNANHNCNASTYGHATSNVNFLGYHSNSPSTSENPTVNDHKKETSKKKTSSKKPCLPGEDPDWNWNVKVSSEKKTTNRPIKRNLNEVPDQIPELPIEFKNKISSLNSGIAIKDEILVIQKILCNSDIEKGQNRFSIPSTQIENGFLTANEEEYVEGRDKNEKNLNKMEVNLIDPSMKNWKVNFGRWVMNKESSRSISYVVNRPWGEIVKENNLKEGDHVQLWAVRVEGALWFALVRLPHA